MRGVLLTFSVTVLLFYQPSVSVVPFVRHLPVGDTYVIERRKVVGFRGTSLRVGQNLEIASEEKNQTDHRVEGLLGRPVNFKYYCRRLFLR